MLGIKLRSTLTVLVFFAGGCAVSVNAIAAPPDPFNTEELTTPNPQTYWIKPADLTVNDTASVQAAAQLPQRSLTLTEITDFALQNNPNTRLAWYQAKAAAANVGIAESAYLPQVNAGLAVQYTANVFTSPSSSQTAYGPNFSFSYLLLDFGNRSNTLLAARYAQIAANLNQNNAIQQVILQVQQAYYQVLGLQAVVGANQQSLKQAKTSLDSAQALRQNGMATIGDVYQAEASYAQAHLDLQTSQGNYQTALGQLAVAMGLPTNIRVRVVALHNPPEAQIDRAMNQLLAAAKRNRPDLLAAEANVRQSEAQLAATKASILPTLTLDATALPDWLLTNNTNSGTLTTTTLTLSVPLFTGFSYTYSVRQAQAQVQAAQATRDQLNQQVQFQVWQNYYALQTAANNIGTAETLLKSSIQAYNQAIGQYKGGVGNILTVLTTQATLAAARVQNIQAKLNWYIALAQLAASVGSLTGSSAQDLSL